MAFENISDSSMYDQIMEVSDKLRLSDWDLGFLENIEGWAHDDNLSPGKREQLERIFQIACDSDF